MGDFYLDIGVRLSLTLVGLAAQGRDGDGLDATVLDARSKGERPFRHVEAVHI